MKVFISQPMRGKSDEEIVEERDKAYKAIFDKHGHGRNQDIEVIDSYKPAEFEDSTPLQCLAESIKMLDEADVAYFMPGWKYARGCRIEHAVAVMYGIPRCEMVEL